MPEILPFIGVSTQPVTNKNSFFRRMMAYFTDDLHRLIIMKMAHGSIRGQVDVKWIFLLWQAGRKIMFFKAHFWVVRIMITGLFQQIIIDVYAEIGLQHIIGQSLVDIFIQSRVFGGDPRNEIKTVSTAAAQVENTQPFKALTLIIDYFIKNRAQEYA